MLVIRIRSWTVAGAIRADRGEDGVLHALELERNTDLPPVGELGDRPMPLRPIGIKHVAKAVVVVLAGKYLRRLIDVDHLPIVVTGGDQSPQVVGTAFRPVVKCIMAAVMQSRDAPTIFHVDDIIRLFVRSAKVADEPMPRPPHDLVRGIVQRVQIIADPIDGFVCALVVTTLPGEKSLRSTIGVGEIAHDPKGLAGLVHRAHAVRSSKYALVGVDAAKDDVGPVGRQRHHLLERVTPVGAVKAVTNDRIPSLNYDQWGLAGRLLALVHVQVAIERNNLVEVVKTLLNEERMLQAAAYVVCAYLTGMRDCEVQAMRAGCLSLTRSEDGLIMRHRVRSVAYKGKQCLGEPAEWITIAPIVQAIQVLEHLSARVATARSADTLWPVLVAKVGSKDHVSAEIVRQLNAYRDHLNTLFGTDKTPIIPPGPDGLPWRITTRQFRRTIAWHIANRPFGSIAGMIQYKHASVAAFEGYAGSSKSGFRAEVEAQRALGQIDDILDYFDDRRAGRTPSGPAGPRISKTLDEAADQLGPLPAMMADRARLRALLASVARTLHVGLLADCFFDPSTALCLKQATESERSTPLVALCQPTRCPNACITTRHQSVWGRAAEEARILLREKRLSELQRVALRRDLDRIEAILDEITTPASADPPPRSSWI